MPNRILKETICTSDSINNLSQASEIMWYRLLVNCDDYGTMDARPSILLSKCFPLKVKAISESMIEKWVQELSANGLIQLYTNDNRRYLYLSKWEKHQQIRAHKAKNPRPVDEGSILISDDINGNHLQANVPVIQSNPIQSESNPNPTIASSGARDEIFETCWQAYPKKLGKSAVSNKAKDAIAKIGVDKMVKAITAYVKDYRSRPGHTDDSYMMHGSTWFNGRYTDWLDAQAPVQQSPVEAAGYRYVTAEDESI